MIAKIVWSVFDSVLHSAKKCLEAREVLVKIMFETRMSCLGGASGCQDAERSPSVCGVHVALHGP